jgi:hypothetical protein
MEGGHGILNGYRRGRWPAVSVPLAGWTRGAAARLGLGSAVRSAMAWGASVLVLAG